MDTREPPRESGAFSRLELLVALVALGVILAVHAPLWAGADAAADKAVCFNNLRRLGLAELQYAAENDSRFVARLLRPAWPERLRPYYSDTSLLRCPADPKMSTFTSGTNAPADAAPRSYLANAFSDYFAAVLTPEEFRQYMAGQYSKGIPISAMAEPATTVLLGEKRSESGHFWLDLMPPTGGDITECELGRHFKSQQRRDSGGSNHAFADGSVRFLGFGDSLRPTNLWAVVPAWRTNSPAN